MNLTSILAKLAPAAKSVAKSTTGKVVGGVTGLGLLNTLAGLGRSGVQQSAANLPTPQVPLSMAGLNSAIASGAVVPQGQTQPLVKPAQATPTAQTYQPYTQAPSAQETAMADYTNQSTQPETSSNPLQQGYQDVEKIKQQRLNDYLTRTGVYSDTGLAQSPDADRGITGSADDIYGDLISKKQSEVDAMKNTSTKGYGAGSALEGLPANAVNLVYKMADDFQSAPIVKNFNTVQSSVMKANNIVDTINRRPDKQATAGDDMALMYLFAKAQDPESVVRESEYENVAQYFSNLPTNVQFKLSTLYKPTPDGRLTTESRQAMLGGLGTLYDSQKEQYDNLKSGVVNRVNNIAGRDVSDLFLNNYEDAYKPSKNSTGGSSINQTMIDTARSQGYTDQEIQDYMKSKGLGGGFKPVGNTSASVTIPQSSRLSYVNNNPGNLRFAGQAGAVKGEGGFAKFTSPQAGVQALSNQIKLDTSRGLTLAGFVGKYAPPTENNTSQYLKQATSTLGVNPSTPLKDIPHDALVKFMALKESSTKLS